jgi:DNA-binding transcriptional ArsR family regulator
MLKYMFIVPCIILLLVILISSSNASADAGDDTVAVELSPLDTASSPSMAVKEPEESSTIVMSSNLNLLSDIDKYDIMNLVRASDDNISRYQPAAHDAIISQNRFTYPNQFTYLDSSLLANYRTNNSDRVIDTWLRPELVPMDFKAERVEYPPFELTNDQNMKFELMDNLEPNNQVYINQAFEKRPQWIREDLTTTHISVQQDTVAIECPKPHLEEIIDRSTQTAETRVESLKKDIIWKEPKDHPPDPSKPISIVEKEESKINIEKRIIQIDPVPQLPLPLFSRIANPMANGSIRGEILEFIRANPGEHMSKIKRRFNLSTSSAVHHLSILERSGNILSHKDGKFKRYFANENGYRSSIDGEYKAIFSVLKNENSRLIAMHLLSNPHSTLSEVSMVTGLNPSTVHWHAERLESVKIISKSKDGKNVRYFVENKEIVEKVVALLNT